jgi:Ca-activated chloride channel family protein
MLDAAVFCKFHGPGPIWRDLCQENPAWEGLATQFFSPGALPLDVTAAVEAAIRATKPAGRTPLYASLYTALSELDKDRRADARRRAIVVLSDGQDTSSTFTFEDILPAVQRQAVPIYTIAPRATRVTKSMRERLFGESTMRADFELRKLAGETGGRAFFPVSLVELTGVYDDIATELSHQYSLGYQSSNAVHDGSFRRIALKVSVPGVQWRTRSGYLAERASGLARGDEQ